MTQIVFDYKPLPVHAPFHRSQAYERCMFGAFGSGKTYSLCSEAIALALEQPGIRGLVTRFTIPELRDTTETVFFDILPNELYKAGESKRSGGHYESFTFPNGSTILFRGIDDWNKHKSLNVGFIAYDEADEFDEETYLGMLSRVRQRDPTREGKARGAGNITRRCVILASNPAGHNWLWRRFVNPVTAAPHTEHFTSTSLDNPYLPVEYIRSLFDYPEPWVKRYVLCQFDDFAGQIYEQWAYDTHVIEPIKSFPPGSVFWMGMDPGTRHPTAGLWVYRDVENNRLVAVDEYKQTGLEATKHAAAWRIIEAKRRARVRWRVADPNSITVRDRGSNMSLQDQYARLGFHFDLGPSSEPARVQMLGQLIGTRRFVTTKDCPMTYEAIKNAQWEELTAHMRSKGIDAPEKVKKKDMDLVDCAQYLASRQVKPMKLAVPKAPMTTNQEIHAAINKQIKNKAQARFGRNHDLGTVVV